MNRRSFIAGGVATVGVGVFGWRTGVAMPKGKPKADGSTPDRAIPVETPTRLGDWTVTVLGRSEGSGIGVQLTVTYHGTTPRQVFQDLDFNLLGHDKRLHTLFDGTTNNFARDAFFDIVTDGATTEGTIMIAMDQTDMDHPEAVELVVQRLSDDDGRAILRPTRYLYFLIDKDAPAA